MIVLGLALGLLVSAGGADGPDPTGDDLSRQLLTVKRLFIDRFSGGEASQQLRDMVIASLQKTKLFIITENPDRADAVLRGSGEDLVFTDTFQTSDGLQARASVNAGEKRSSRESDYYGAQTSVGDSQSTRIVERKHEASASVRIVSRDGDVLWSTVQESLGGKFKSASADVADRIAKQLVSDLQKLRTSAPPPSLTGAASSEVPKPQ